MKVIKLRGENCDELDYRTRAIKLLINCNYLNQISKLTDLRILTNMSLIERYMSRLGRTWSDWFGVFKYQIKSFMSNF